MVENSGEKRRLTDAQAEQIARLAKEAGSGTSGNRAYMPPDREPLLALAGLLTSVHGPWLERWYARWPATVRLVTSDSFAASLALLLVHGNTVKGAIDVIDRILTSTTPVAGSLCVGLRGPIVTERVDLGDGIVLGPATDFPSPGRFLWDDRDLLPERATCCIKLSLEPEIPFKRGPLEKDGWDHPERPGLENSYLEGCEVAALLGLLMFPVAVRFLGACFSFDSPLLNLLSGCETGPYWLPPRALGQSAPTAKPLQGNIAAAWAALRGYGTKRDSILLACDRIARFAHQQRLQDKCLEACIALEALFAGEGRDAATFKAIRRCVRFLRAGVEARSVLGRDLNRMMKLRGNVAHGTSFRPLTRAARPSELQAHAEDERCVVLLAQSVVEAVRRILALGTYPTDDEWDYQEWEPFPPS